MKFIRFLGFFLVFVPAISFAASGTNFQNASQLLSAARRGDTQTVQILINRGTDVNYVDSTGLSLVCTAVMNNDTRAIQILQMYGADASNCDRQIKNYQQKSRVAARGEEYGFFSGLSSSHIIALSAVGVAAVIGGVALLTDAFDAKNDNGASSSGGSHSGGGGGGSSGSGASKWAAGATPYGPAYVDTTTGKVDTSIDVTANLASWDTQSASALRRGDFNYLRLDTENNFVSDGLNPLLQNYLLVMGGYYSFANGYMGQNIFRNSSNEPVLAAITDAQSRPVRVALITGNGINPAGSADSASGITYAIGTALDSATPTVDKYLNNTLSGGVETENQGFNFSGSGSAFNPYANVNDSALAKIVAGWESGGRNNADLYGFVPNGQLAIYRTGNGSVWNIIPDATSGVAIGTFSDADDNAQLSVGDSVVLNGTTYSIVTALSQTSVVDPELVIAGTTYDLSTNSKIFIGQCGASCPSVAIYVGTDGAWYVNSTGGNDIDNVYIADSGNVYEYKAKSSTPNYYNFMAMSDASGRTYHVPGETVDTTVDLIANTNVLPMSRNTSYLSVDYFTTAAGTTSAEDFYKSSISSYYGTGQGGNAHTLFNNYSVTNPMIIMPAGDRLFKEYHAATAETSEYYETFWQDLSATFENYAPFIYGNNLKHNFMTVVAVSSNATNGTSDVTNISDYSAGPLVLSQWYDTESKNIYTSRKCGITGTGGGSVDPWCFAASGPTAEMATAAAAGAVASVKSAFSYMTNDQVFTLLALTADGPFLGNLGNTSSTAKLSTDDLVEHLRGMYKLPVSYNEDSLSSDDYLSAFKEVFGYGLINLQRAIKPGYSVYYYSDGNIVSSPNNAFWGNVAQSSTNPRASTVVSGRGTVRTAFYDVLESADGTLSLPRVWNMEFDLGKDVRHGLYMGDVLGEFAVDSTNKHSQTVGDMTFDMTMSPRAYVDNMNGLDNLNISFSNEKYDLDAGYQHYLTDGQSRFDGRANGVLGLVSNGVVSGVRYKFGNFAFGARAFSGAISDENLLDNDPVVSAQFEPARLGLANGAMAEIAYNNEKFGFDVSFGNMHETNTVLGSISDGILALNGANTQYVDAVAKYRPFENANLFARATFATTRANVGDGIISSVSDIKSNAFALGADVGGFNFTASMPLAVVDGRMGYDYADLNVVESNGKYTVAINNPHVEYIDMVPEKREFRFSGAYKKSLGEFTDAGFGFIYRVNPGNTDAFGNESIFMFKLHHRLGI